MNSRIIGIIILVVAIGGATTYFLTKPDSINTNSIQNTEIDQNEKIGLVINTVNPPQSIDVFKKIINDEKHKKYQVSKIKR